VKDWLEVLRNPDWLVVGALSILGLLYLIRLSLDFIKSTILPRVYELRLQRRSILLPMAQQVLDASWTTAAFFRDGDPKLIDFRNGYIFPRPELTTLRGALHKGRFAHIQGPPSSGKTVIALNLAYEKTGDKRIALYFDRPALLTDDLFKFLSSPGSERYIDKQGAVFVVDDVHLDTVRASRLFSLVFAQYAKLSLVFVSRPLHANDVEIDSEGFFNFSRYMPVIDVRAETIIEPLANFFSHKRFNHAIAPPILKAFTEECGNDLLLLGRYLREWDGSSLVHLPEIRRKVFHTVQQDLESLRRFAPDAITVLLVVSMFYRYEVAVERTFLEHDIKVDISNLIKRGDLKEQNGFILLYHSSLAKLYTNVCRSLLMPEYAELSSRFSLLPSSLFSAYVRSRPRNVCEMIIGVRKTREILPSILRQTDLHNDLRSGLEKEQDARLLGWAMILIDAADHRQAWRVLESFKFNAACLDLVSTATPTEVALFLLNVAKLSLSKGAEYIRCVPESTMARCLESMPLKTAAATLSHIRRFSEPYSETVANLLDPGAICQQFLREDNLEDLRIGLHRIAWLLRDRVCIKVSETEDAFGEPMSKVAFYFGSVRVVRFLKGWRLAIPYGASPAAIEGYWLRMIRCRRPACSVTLDEGAALAFARRISIFPVGVRSVAGEFDQGDIVVIKNLAEVVVGVGVSNFSSLDLRRVRGKRSSEIFAIERTTPNKVMDNDLTLGGERFQRISAKVAIF
jgi:hypothetical protein